MPCPTCKQPVGEERNAGEVSDDLLRRIIREVQAGANVLRHHSPNGDGWERLQAVVYELERIQTAR